MGSKTNKSAVLLDNKHSDRLQELKFATDKSITEMVNEAVEDYLKKYYEPNIEKIKQIKELKGSLKL